MVSPKVGQIARPVSRIVPRYYPSRPVSTYPYQYLLKEEERVKSEEARRQEEKMREEWLKTKARLTGLGGLAVGAAGAYGLSQLAQEYKEEKERIRKEVLAAEIAQHEEHLNAFFDELKQDPLFGPAVNFDYLSPLYRSYVLKEYKDRVIQEGVNLAQFIPESNFSDVLLLAKNNLEKRYDLWKKLLQREEQDYFKPISPQQLAQVEHDWLNSKLSIEGFLETKKETLQEKKDMIDKYKALSKWRGWGNPSWELVENAMPESTKNLINDYKTYSNLWKEYGPRELESIKVKKYYKPKIIQRTQLLSTTEEEATTPYYPPELWSAE
ncbi:MAG: hypothetical protein OHK0036_18820 [Bacteroidia bacterium]